MLPPQNGDWIFTIEIETKYGTTTRKKRLSEIRELDQMLQLCYPIVTKHLPEARDAPVDCCCSTVHGGEPPLELAAPEPR